ncbi:o-succinylbenzoate synthase [Endozoicomonas ascidiicola]|uniref:o-succinylbenzoate synthase n=1 Tax=Endozoicomonas ascidiicola TaxID=1698521 RepID=UPI0008352C20|nr:o-succinylbenzoate synthase [Endozoicomonas ascidiicola]
MMKVKADIVKYRLPLKHPIAVNQHSISEREGLILCLQAGDRFGYGDIAPLPGFSRETLKEAEKQLLSFCSAVNAKESLQDIENLSFLQNFSLMPSVSFGIESALWWLKQDHWLPQQPSIPLLQGDIQKIVDRLKHWQGERQDAWQGKWPAEFKVKTGRHLRDDDVFRIHQILQILPDSVSIKLDANRQWSFDQACAFAEALKDAIDVQRIAFVEEPTVCVDDFTTLYDKTGLRFALDETVQEQGFTVQPMSGLAAIIIKPTLVGGLKRCQALIESARQHGIRAMISSSYESVIGLHILYQLSARWIPEELPGLDTASVFRQRLIIGDVSASGAIDFDPTCCER